MSSGDHSQADRLQNRLIDFGVTIIRLSSRLPRTPTGKHVATQLMRSGTSPAPNYAEARAAESAADFTHKIAVALKELNEAQVWIKMIDRSELLSHSLTTPVLDEAEQLARIMAASLRTARANQRVSAKPAPT